MQKLGRDGEGKQGANWLTKDYATRILRYYWFLSPLYTILYCVIYVYCVYYSDFFSVYCVLTLCILLCVPFVFMYGLFVLIVVVDIAYYACLFYSCNCVQLLH